MQLDPVVLAIPVFIGLIILELSYEYFTNRKTYQLGDAISNISTGALQQVSGTFLQIVSIGIYTYIYKHFALWQIPKSWLSFFVLFILYDLCYYWYHRMSHEVSLFWGGHVVHHQSEEYNLSVALRQSGTSFLWSFLFYLPLAVLGFDPVQFVLVGGLNLLYQFWIHTEHINKMGWFEVVFNTPSHHRVHHARDVKYIDKNYAGVFIVWDKMFGTFIEEQERPHYGITTPINTWNPIYANVLQYVNLAKYSFKAKSVSDALGILFNKPGWLPDYLGGYQAPKDVPADYQKYQTPNTFNLNIYVFFQFVLFLGAISYYMFFVQGFSVSFKIMLAAWVAFSALVLALLLQKHPWARALEMLRIALLLMLVWYKFY